MQAYVWKVYDQRWGSWYIICSRLLTVVWGGPCVSCQRNQWTRSGRSPADGDNDGGREKGATLEVFVSKFCHMLTGSVITSQSGQADWRSLAKVDFPTAVFWEDRTENTSPLKKLLLLLLPYYYNFYDSNLILLLPMLPSMDTRFILAAASWAELEKLWFPDFWAITVSSLSVLPPTAAVIHRAEGMFPSLLAGTEHVCIFNWDRRLNSTHRYIL